MFSTATCTPNSASSSATPIANPRAYSRCQRNGGWTTTVPAPAATATSHEVRSFGQGSVPQTRWVISSVGACSDTIGRPWCSDSERSASALWLTGSVQTMTSMPSYPSRAAISNVVAQFNGYAEAVDSDTLAGVTRTTPSVATWNSAMTPA